MGSKKSNGGNGGSSPSPSAALLGPPPPPPSPLQRKPGRPPRQPPPPPPAIVLNKGGRPRKPPPPPPAHVPNVLGANATPATQETTTKKRKHMSNANEAAPTHAAPPPPPSKKTKGATKNNKAAEKDADGDDAAADGVLPRMETPRQKPLAKNDRSLRVLSWNVGGLRAALKNDRVAILQKLVKDEKPHVLCLQEHKLQEQHLVEVEEQLKTVVPGYSCHWAVSTSKAGYSGVVCLVSNDIAGEKGATSALTAAERAGASGGAKKAAGSSKQTTLSFGAATGSSKSLLPPTAKLASITEGIGGKKSEYNTEGRVLTLVFSDPSLALVFAYVPNSGQDLKRLDYRINVWEKDMTAYLDTFKSKAIPVTYVGDLNVAHLDEDIWNVTAKHIAKSAGTTPQERAAFGDMLEHGYVDSFRALHPHAKHVYTYWSVRAGNKPKNRGLRLDYAVVSQDMAPSSKTTPRVHDAAILDDADKRGDHAPVFVEIRL